MIDLIQADFVSVGTAQLVSSVSIVTVKCPCKEILMGQMGLPIPCHACKRVWFVTATAKIKIQEVLGDFTKELTGSSLING